MSESSTRSPYHVLDFFYDDEDNCALTVLSGGVRFHIIADTEKLRSQSAPSQRAAEEFLHLVQKVKSLGADDQDQEKKPADDHEVASPSTDSGVDVTGPDTADSLRDAEAALHDWMMGFLTSDLDRLAPGDQQCDHPTLEEWYDCPTHFFNLEATKDGVRAIELESNQDLHDRMHKLKPALQIPKYIRNLDVPWYSASDLIVLACSDELAAYHPCKVRLRNSQDDKTYFLKLVDEPGPNKREIRLLHRIAKLGLHSELRCPELEALITFSSPTSSGIAKITILGFLQTDIKNPTPLTLKLDPSIPQRQRDEWATEADRMKAVLHKNGIVWGDAKADNFMVDEDEQLWIIDFGGSYTEGWVDQDLNETEAGDDMGVVKIVNALRDPVANTMDPDEEGEIGSEIPHDEENNNPMKSRKRKATDDLDERVAKHKTKTPRLFITQPSDENAGTEHQDEASLDKARTEAQSDEEEEEELDDSSNDGPATPTSRADEREEANQEHKYCYCHAASSGEMVACDNAECANQWFHFECAGLTSAPSNGQDWYCRDCSGS